jgi:chemotaxis regulatin CheY-phosphate phosphatase CheZ
VTVAAPAKVLPRVGHYATNGKRLVYVISESGDAAKRELLVEDATNPLDDELVVEKVRASGWWLVERETDDGL